jgi:OOP family OmpA-OmpF porin
MKRKQLFAVLALTLGSAVTAHAADNFDDRWYFAPWIGMNHNDSDRDTATSTFLAGIGIGKQVAPNTAIDVFYDRTSRPRGEPYTGNWDSDSFGVALRYYFGDPDGWQPYLMGGVGVSSTDANPRTTFDHTARRDSNWDPFLQIGVGVAKSYNENVRFRGEVGYRYDMNDNTTTFDHDGLRFVTPDHYGDVFVQLGVTVAFGAHEAAAAATTTATTTTTTTTQPPKADCRSMDDDKDGVNNCDDKCPGTPAGTIVGPDGCPQKITIDLRGVNFRFDYPKKGVHDINQGGLVEGSIAILDQAVDVLKRYPNVVVDVVGHTDSVGTDQYNQGLSERRASIVYDYLTSHGIDRSRLQGPHGFGESKPIDTNKTKEGRARNRRTELNVQ